MGGNVERVGRARWKIENETFNVMENHAYELNIISATAKRFWQ